MNKAARLAFAVNILENNNDFKNAIYSDESSFQLENVGTFQFQKKKRKIKEEGETQTPYKSPCYWGASAGE